MNAEEMQCAEDFRRHEMAGPTSWDRWVDKVEAEIGVFGVDIDGDRSKAAIAAGREDPCAIDELVDWFDAKWTVGRAVAEVRRRALMQVP
jgi:hypothetical protein